MGCGQSKSESAVVDTSPKPSALALQKMKQAEENKLQLEKEGPSAEPLPDFTPSAAYVIKTKRTTTFQKVFINVFHHDCVPETARYVTRDETWKVDKKGEQCVVFTAVIPSSVYAKIIKDPTTQPEVLFFLCFRVPYTLKLVFGCIAPSRYTYCFSA
jgi:hypothetical protein